MPITEEAAKLLSNNIRGVGDGSVEYLADAFIPEDLTGVEADILFEHALRSLFPEGRNLLNRDQSDKLAGEISDILIQQPKYAEFIGNQGQLAANIKRGLNSLSRGGGPDRVTKLFNELYRQMPDAFAVRKKILRIASVLQEETTGTEDVEP